MQNISANDSIPKVTSSCKKFSPRENLYSLAKKALSQTNIGSPIEMATVIKKHLHYVDIRKILAWYEHCYKCIYIFYEKHGIQEKLGRMHFESCCKQFRLYIRMMSLCDVEITFYRTQPIVGEYKEKIIGQGSRKTVFAAYTIMKKEKKPWRYFPTVAIYFNDNPLTDEYYVEARNIQKRLVAEKVIGIPLPIHHIEPRVGLQEKYSYSLDRLLWFKRSLQITTEYAGQQAKILQCLRYVFHAIDNLHKRMIIHRDIKCENCLVKDLEHRDIELFISDFDGILSETGFTRTIIYKHPFPIKYVYWDPCSCYGIATELTDWYGFCCMLLLSVTDNLEEVHLMKARDLIKDYVIKKKYITNAVSPKDLYPHIFSAPTAVEKICWIAFYVITLQSAILLDVLQSYNRTETSFTQDQEKNLITSTLQVLRECFDCPRDYIFEVLNDVIKHYKKAPTLTMMRGTI